uniref:Uncharacterized protein n=1 Tax=Cacopsylla melanoneura TaxID=428564 RepID=A0A8D8X3X5_9HEMI
MQAFENLYFVLINSSIPFQLSNIPIANFCFPISLQSSAFHRISIPLSLSMSPSFPLSLPTAYHSNFQPFSPSFPIKYLAQSFHFPPPTLFSPMLSIAYHLKHSLPLPTAFQPSIQLIQSQL